jgi:hypothetical protein
MVGDGSCRDFFSGGVEGDGGWGPRFSGEEEVGLGGAVCDLLVCACRLVSCLNVRD